MRNGHPPLTTVELFCGIGGFRVASERLGLSTIWANDHDHNACLVYGSQFGTRGLLEADIEDVAASIPRHDLLTAGFPCQPFSSAGKKRGIRDARGTIFAELARIIERLAPRYFVLENVKRLLSMERGAHFATILDAFAELHYEVEWRLLNACDFGLPQNRQRVFVVGVREDGDVADRPRLATGADLNLEELPTLTSLSGRLPWQGITSHGRRFPTWGIARKGLFVGRDLAFFSARKPAPRLEDVLLSEVEDAYDFTDSTIERLRTSAPVHSFIHGVEVLSNQRGGARMGYTVYGTRGLAPTLTCTTSRHYERYKVGDRYRRLTNVEYARIQGFRDDHCAVMPPQRQYVLFGNAVPPPMAEWVIARTVDVAVEEGEPLVNDAMPQLTLAI